MKKNHLIVIGSIVTISVALFFIPVKESYFCTADSAVDSQGTPLTCHEAKELNIGADDDFTIAEGHLYLKYISVNTRWFFYKTFSKAVWLDTRDNRIYNMEKELPEVLALWPDKNKADRGVVWFSTNSWSIPSP